MRSTVFLLAMAIGFGGTGDMPIQEFIVGRWQIQMDRSFEDYEARNSTELSPSSRETIRRGWNSVSRFDISSTAVTFYRSSGPVSYSYEVIDADADSINLRLYHLHDEFQISLKRRDEYITMGSGSCDFLRKDCELFFYFDRVGS